MLVEMLKSKIHRATVIEADINYQGSITISDDILKKAEIYEYEKVLVVDVCNGARFETYVLSTQQKGIICVNGAAARCVSVGDILIIMSFCLIDNVCISEHKPNIVFVDSSNSLS